MTDPKYAVGDRVRFQGQPAVVTAWDFRDPPDGDEQFIGYSVMFDDGNFSGWHEPGEQPRAFYTSRPAAECPSGSQGRAVTFILEGGAVTVRGTLREGL